MEMEAIEVEAGLLDRAGPSDQKLQTKTEAKEDSKEYCKLSRPADDIYSEAVFPSPPLKEGARVKPTKPTRSRKDVLLPLCIVLLGGICLAELIVIFILNGKTTPDAAPPPSAVCPKPEPERFIQPVRRTPCFKWPRTLTTKFSETGTERGTTAGSSSTPDVTEDVRQAPNSHRCPESWVFFEDSCFYLSNERKTWDGGRTFCQNVTGDLAVISNEKIRTFMTTQAHAFYWIGLRYDTRWKWVNNQIYTSDWPGTKGLCAFLSNELPISVMHTNCKSETQFICRKRAS